MKTINEQLLTAYALDELSPELKAEVEAYLANHPEAAVAVEATRMTANQLRDELMTELQDAPPVTIHRPLRLRPKWVMPLTLAASVAVVAGTFAVLIHQEADTRVKSQSNMTQMGSALLVYANERHAGQQSLPLPTTAADPAFRRSNADAFNFDSEGVKYQPRTAAQSLTLEPQAESATYEKSALVGTQKDNIYALGKGLGQGGPSASLGMPTAGKKPGEGGAGDVSKREDRFLRPATPAKPGEKSEISPMLDQLVVTGNVTGGREFRGKASGDPKPIETLRNGVKSTDQFEQPARQTTIVQKESEARQFPQLHASLKPADAARAGDAVLGLKIDGTDHGGVATPAPSVAPQPLGDLRINDTGHNTEAYDRIVDNAFLDAVGNPLSTFSIDVDTASYSNMRRFITGGQLPPKDAVRIEELVNYFPYQYEGPKEKEKPFAASVEIAGCPWNTEHRLVRVGIKGREMSAEQRPASNLVFLIDVSGSMNQPNKLPLVKQSLRELVNKLDSRDRVAMVVYAGNSGLVLESTPVGGFSDKDASELWKTKYEPMIRPPNDEKPTDYKTISEDQARVQFANEVAALKADRAGGKQKILAAIDRLEAGGSTNGGAGIELAYLTAQSGFIKDGTNRVVLATDGDWNVGVTDQGALTRLIEDKAKGGTFLTVLGFGMGNTKDSTMEKLADKGNGNYAYIDTLAEAKKVLVEQMSGTLVTIAKDVKIQVEFNPAKVASYRLIGYENRLLAKEDFNDDKKDAGEIGAGHTVTALYEVVPPGVNPPTTQPGVDPLKYRRAPDDGQQGKAWAPPANINEMLTLKLRYKAPDAPADVQGTSKLLEFPITDAGKGYAQASEDFKFAAAVAGFGMILRDSPHKGTATFDSVIELAGEGKGPDANGYRAEFIQLAQQAKAISGK